MGFNHAKILSINSKEQLDIGMYIWNLSDYFIALSHSFDFQ